MRALAWLGVLALLGACGDDAADDDTDDDGEEQDESADAGDGQDESDAGAQEPLGFFVSSDKSATGNLGGLAAADARCQSLAEAVGAGDRTWHAYLSTESGGEGGGPVHARDRIGAGPWHNAHGELIASDLDALHARSGDAALFLDESGKRINGQWPGSPDPNEHDILTGSDEQGRVIEGFTCSDWTSESADQAARVGHSDGLGPDENPDPPYNSWNSSHDSESCADTAPRGGAGRIYCFAAD